MAQKYIMLGKKGETDLSKMIKIHQPDEDMEWSWETIYDESSGRPRGGKLTDKPMFTVERWDYSATHLTDDELSRILKIIVAKHYTVYCYSPYYGKWRIDEVQTGSGSCAIQSLKQNDISFHNLSFAMVGVNPIG